MARLIYHPGAEAEIREAAEWYERARPGLGQEYLRAVEAAVRSITERPTLWRKLGRGYYRRLVRRFPYAVIYRIDEDAIVVVAVPHVKRRPGYWRNRDRE